MIENYIPPMDAASFIARVFLGILFFVQGYDKIFKLKISGVVETIRPAYRKLKLPDGVITFTAYFTSIVEFVGGLLLIIGLFRYEAYYLLGLDLLIVCLGMSLVNALWDMQYVLPRLILLLFLLMLPVCYDHYALDTLFNSCVCTE